MRYDDEKQQLIINANYQLFLLMITLLSIANSVIWLFPIEESTRSVILLIDYGISIFLLADFFIRLITTRNKRLYLINYYGWLDFLGSLPVFGLRLARLARFLILGRKIRRSDIPEIENIVVERRAQSTLLIAIFFSILIFELSGIAILNAELESPGANIQTASDALWWAYVTVATVGYGDRYPVTNTGRIVAVFLMTAGVGLFSVLTSFLADWFRRPRKSSSKSHNRAGAISPKNVNASLDEIQRLIQEHQAQNQQTMAELQAKIDEIKRSLDA
jgi:voltage-gated potassium channel